MTKYKNRGCAGNRRADPCPGGCWLRHYPLCSADLEAAKALKEIKKNKIHIPLVADIHFDYRLAIAAMENGADKIRINPRKYWKHRAYQGSCRCGEGAEYSHPCWG